MSTNCKCLNPEGGGTKCPTQHIALCIRGKDRECHGECIPIPNEFKNTSESFAFWSESVIKEKVVEHIKEFEDDYKAFGSKEYVSNMLRTIKISDFQGFSGRLKYTTTEQDSIEVSFSFSFEENIDPNENQMLAF